MFKITVSVVRRTLLTNVRCISHTQALCLPHENQNKSISECYAGKSVFITGGTGFLGKVLIERLLHNCVDLNKIYVLIREKEGVSSDRRLQQMFDVPLFDSLKEINPDALKKIVAVGGDITKKQLGINPDDEKEIIDNVSVVFHSAATVRFADPLQTLLEQNYEATKKVMNLSKKIKNLETFVYISTAFSNGDKSIIDEFVYPPPRTEAEVKYFIEDYRDTPHDENILLRGLPNTYTLTKSLCEHYVKKNREHMPSIILRPAIVCPVLDGPLPGWLDSWVATSALYSDVARGLTKAVHGQDDVLCDMIPVDYVSNLAIIAAARGNNTNDVLVYNSASSEINPITWKEASDLFLEESLKHGGIPGELKPFKMLMYNSPMLVKLAAFLLQTTPAFFGDVLLKIRGERPRHLRMQERAVLLREILKNFTSISLLMKSSKARELISTLSEEDKVRFPCDPRNIIWRKYLQLYYRGVQKYMWKK